DVFDGVRARAAAEPFVDQLVAVVVDAVARLRRSVRSGAADPAAEIRVARLDAAARAERIGLRARADLVLLGDRARTGHRLRNAVAARVLAGRIGAARVAGRARTVERTLGKTRRGAAEVDADAAAALHVGRARRAVVELLRHT